jgi:AcrR family transcriptional regulator
MTSTTRLKPGRHGLARAEVVASQRARMCQALAEVMAEKGYVATTVADVLRLARVSRETFYQQFASKQDCFIAAFDATAAELMTVVSEAVLATGRTDQAPAEPPDIAQRFEQIISVYLAELAANPAMCRVFLIEVYAAGPAALARRAGVQQRFVELIADLTPGERGSARFACEVLVAAIGSMVTARVAAGDIAGLRSLQAPFVQLVQQAVSLFS